MKSGTKQLLIGVVGAVTAGLILQRFTKGGGAGVNPEFVSGAPYGNSIAANHAVMASAKGPAAPSKASGASGYRKTITFWPEPTYQGKNPFAWGYGTMNADGSGGALI